MNETSIVSENEHQVSIDPFFLKEAGGIVSFLKDKQSNQRNLCCANFHLFWDPRQPEIKLKQINHGLLVVKNLMKNWSEKFRVPMDDIGLIICGDFNSGTIKFLFYGFSFFFIKLKFGNPKFIQIIIINP